VFDINVFQFFVHILLEEFLASINIQRITFEIGADIHVGLHVKCK
jgi:hypothetical protein